MSDTTISSHLATPTTQFTATQLKRLPAPYLTPWDFITQAHLPKPNTKANEEADTLTADDIIELAEHGIDKDSLEYIAEAVNEQLSSNANATEEKTDTKDTQTKTDSSNQLHQPTTPTANQSHGKHKPSQPTQGMFTEPVDTTALDDNARKKTEAQQEQQYEAFKQYLAKKSTQQKTNYRQVRINIEANALPTKMFFIMNGLAAIIAGYGLLANSPAVVIGAMLVAMLIGPISGIALGIIDARIILVKKSLLTLLYGGIFIYAIGLVLGYMHPEQALSQEIIARTSPNTMDVMVALAGGTAGAYAMISPNLSVAVVGVAVATALVPPLTASGILLANGEYKLALGAFLLTLTNILAIQFTNALVLWITGFRRLDTEDSDNVPEQNARWQQALLFIKRNAISLLLLIAISIYLAFNFQQRLKQQAYETAVTQLIEKSIANQPSYIVSTNFGVKNKLIANTVSKPSQDSNRYVIRVLLQGLTPPTHTQVSALENQIKALTAQRYPNRAPIKLQVRFVPESVIETSPISADDVKLDGADLNQIEQSKP